MLTGVQSRGVGAGTVVAVVVVTVVVVTLVVVVLASMVSTGVSPTMALHAVRARAHRVERITWFMGEARSRAAG